jgi:hypothetical protein
VRLAPEGHDTVPPCAALNEDPGAILQHQRPATRLLASRATSTACLFALNQTR